jgi:hypothetical protein
VLPILHRHLVSLSSKHHVAVDGNGEVLVASTRSFQPIFNFRHMRHMDEDSSAVHQSPTVLTKFEKPVLLLINGPAITPCFHLFPTLCAPDVDCGDDFVDSESTAEHG